MWIHLEVFCWRVGAWLRIPPFDLAMEKPNVPDFCAMESWLLIVIMQICFQQLVRRMGVVMSPVDFIQQRSDGPCLFGTHHDFDDQPSPWRATGEASGVSVGRRPNAAAGVASGASSGSRPNTADGPVEPDHPPPNWEEDSESELEPEPKERPWKRGRFD